MTLFEVYGSFLAKNLADFCLTIGASQIGFGVKTKIILENFITLSLHNYTLVYINS